MKNDSIIRFKQFTVAPATEADVAGIGEAHLQAARDTYPNEHLGVDIAWINEHLGFLASESGNEHRRKIVQKTRAKRSAHLYLVVKNRQGTVCGFLHVQRRPYDVYLSAIYLLEEARGTGLAQRLMQEAVAFAGGRPMSLRVADYNRRALRFYEHSGFVLQPGAPRTIHGRLPVVVMKRPRGEKQ